MTGATDTPSVDRHRKLLQKLTSPSGAISAGSPHASDRNPDWFSSSGQPLEERTALHREFMRDFRAERPNVLMNRQAILLAGPPGAGKTTAQNELIASTGTTEDNWRVLNADDFKDRILKRALEDGSYTAHLTPNEVAAAEANGAKVWPRERAALVHEESSLLMKRARDRSIRLGENVIIDGTLSNADAGEKLVKRLEEQGYTVRIALVDGPRKVTAARVSYRWTRGYENAAAGRPDPEDPDLLTLGGRWVPAEVTDALYRDGDDLSVCSSAAQAIAKSSPAVEQLDVYRVTEPGGKPALIKKFTGKRSDGRWTAIHRFPRARATKSVRQSAPTITERTVTVRNSSVPCSVCGRPLRSAESIARGAGPACAGQHPPA